MFGLGFRVRGSGFGVGGLGGFGGLGSLGGLGFRIWGLGFRMSCC